MVNMNNVIDSIHVAAATAAKHRASAFATVFRYRIFDSFICCIFETKIYNGTALDEYRIITLFVAENEYNYFINSHSLYVCIHRLKSLPYLQPKPNELINEL